MNYELQKRVLSSIFLIPISLFFIIKGSYFFNLFLIICLSISIFEWDKMSRNKKYYLFGIFFIFFSFYTFYRLRTDFKNDYFYGDYIGKKGIVIYSTVTCEREVWDSDTETSDLGFEETDVLIRFIPNEFLGSK